MATHKYTYDKRVKSPVAASPINNAEDQIVVTLWKRLAANTIIDPHGLSIPVDTYLVEKIV